MTEAHAQVVIGCPFPHAAMAGIQRSRADLMVRKVLRVRERANPGIC